MWSDDYDDDYSKLLWKRRDKLSFFYSLKKVRSTNLKFKKWMIALLFGMFVWIVFTLYIWINVPLNGDTGIFLLSMGLLFSLIIILFIWFVLFEHIRFTAGIYDKWIMMWDDCRTYKELKEVKLYQYPDNWNEYIKLIYTEFDDKILTKTFLWDPKMDEFLDRFQDALLDKWIDCEKISDIKNIDISDEVEYKVYFWFFSVWKLLSLKEKLHRIKNILIFVFVYFIFAAMFLFASILWWWDDDNISFNERLTSENILERFNFWITFVLVLLVILIIFLTIHFILSVKKFYARIENNTVYIHNWYWWKWPFLSDDYVLSKIKVNYWFIIEWNMEWIVLTIDDWKENMVFKRPKHEKVERFCSNLLDEVRKHKKL